MIYNILEYGAVGDGRTDCAAAIQKAIDRCSVEGGRVVIPAGRFLSGFLQLKSNVELYLEQGAALVSALSDEEEKYFLFACHGENITISGNGTIDGQGRLRCVDDNADYGEMCIRDRTYGPDAGIHIQSHKYRGTCIFFRLPLEDVG